MPIILMAGYRGDNVARQGLLVGCSAIHQTITLKMERDGATIFRSYFVHAIAGYSWTK